MFTALKKAILYYACETRFLVYNISILLYTKINTSKYIHCRWTVSIISVTSKMRDSVLSHLSTCKIQQKILHHVKSHSFFHLDNYYVSQQVTLHDL